MRSLLFTLALAAAGPALAGGGHPFEIGQPFPALKLPRLSDGRPMSVDELGGKKLVLHVFASW